MGQLTTTADLVAKRAFWRANRQTIVWTNGCFDLLHAGHVRTLRDARSQGDVLIVGVNSDRSVRANKGPSRPVIPESYRAEMVAALQCVDFVVIFDDNTPTQILDQLRPDVHCKGEDYKDGKKAMPEAETVRSYGGRVAFLPLYDGLSTSSIIERIRGELRQGPIDPPAEEFFSIPSLVDRFSASRVLVVGDVMLDEYIIGGISRISPEAPVPILDVQEKRYSCGGAANVAANVASLSGSAFLAGLIGEDQPGTILKQKLETFKIRTEALIESKESATICKTRFVAGQQQIVRVDQENRRALTGKERAQLLLQIRNLLPETQVCILSDYAKGLLDETTCGELIRACRQDGKAVIVDPKGRNFSKYRGCSLITPNLKEAGIAAGIDIHSEADVYAAGKALLDQLPGTAVLLTRGSDGMTLFCEGQQPLSVPTVARNVFDVVGAGDTAVATLAVALGAALPLESCIKLANIAAGIAVEKHGTVAVGIDELAAHSEALTLLSSAGALAARNAAGVV